MGQKLTEIERKKRAKEKFNKMQVFNRLTQDNPNKLFVQEPAYMRRKSTRNINQ